MSISHRITATVAAIGLAAGTVIAAAPMASATAGFRPTTCTAAQRAELKATMADARAEIASMRQTDDERATARAELRASIADLKAKAKAEAGGAPLSADQKAQLRADIQALVTAHKDALAARHSAIADLKQSLVDARTELRACRA